MKERRILLVLSNAPAPFGNAAARWYYVLLKGLQEAGYRVTAFAASTDPRETEAAYRLFPAGKFDLRCYPFPQRTGMSAKWETFRRPHSYNFSGDLRRDLRAEMALGFDVLHCEQTWTGWLGLDVPKQTVVNVHYSFQIDCAHMKPATFRERAMMVRTQQAERYLLRHFPVICTLTRPLAERVQLVNPRARVEVIPLGIDSKLYEYRERTPDAERPVIGMVGSFDWQPTFLAGQRLLCRLWPRIQAEIPGARLMLVGRNARSAMERLGSGPGVEFHENVPDTAPYFHSLNAFLYAPTHGSGMKVKVLEAFAFGAPVVTTKSGAEGLPVQSGVHAMIGDNDEELIQETLALLREPDRAAHQARAGRRLLELWCAPELAVGQFANLYETMQVSPQNCSNDAATRHR
jgi:glycosyltransferase involved in cell wall biosynthesis